MPLGHSRYALVDAVERPGLPKASLRKWLTINAQPIRRMAKKRRFFAKVPGKDRFETLDAMVPASHLESSQLWNLADEQAEGVHQAK